MKKFASKLSHFKRSPKSGTNANTSGDAKHAGTQEAPGRSKPILASIEMIAPELKGQIFSSLASLKDLNALIRSSPELHTYYLLNRKLLLRKLLQTELGNVFTDAVAALQSGLLDLHQSPRVKQVEFVAFYEEMHSSSLDSIAKRLSIAHLIEIAEFYSIIQHISKEFVTSAFSCTPTDPLSQIETTRIVRALYRFQICCNIFGANRKHPDGLIGEDSRVDGVHILCHLCIYEPWEIEEIACVHAFISKKYEQFFRLIQFDVSRHNPKFAKQLERRPHTPDGCFDFENEVFMEGYREGISSRGLQLFHKVLKVDDHARLVKLISKNIPSVHFEFITAALERVTQHRRRHRWFSDRDRAQDRHERLPFSQDHERTPPLAWVIIWKGTYSNIYGDYIPGELKEWGYVIWDATRLVKTGRKKKLVEQWADAWGHDPRGDIF